MKNVPTSVRLVALALLISPTLPGCDDRRPRDGATTTDPARRSTSPPPVATPPDNSAVNARDRDQSRPTSGDQGNSSEDTRITADIRKAVLAIPGLSVNGQNVKIITEAGKVTLRGPVASESERDAIADKARAVVGVTSVVNELEPQRS